MAPTEHPHAHPALRWLWLLLAWAALALAALGVLLPGLPTTPFLLLAAYAAARGSKRLHAWLHAHAVFGPIIADWERYGAVSRRAKRIAVATMAVCAVVIALTAPRWWMTAIAVLIMTCVAIWLWRRPEPPDRPLP
ncbi:MAG TPA: YbaN family protein [Xanthomonadaceae bacterium]|nr:YbaN family protein [Xanthomonadaceae bacterium]